MPPFPWPGDGLPGRKSKRRVYDESESVLSDDSSMVSSISMGTNNNNRSQQAVVRHPTKRDVEGGVPVGAPSEGPLERKQSGTHSGTQEYSERAPSLRERVSSRVSSSRQSLSSSLSSFGQRALAFCRNNKKPLIIGGIAVLLIVIVVVISVTVTGRDTTEETAPAAPARDQALTDIMSTISTSHSLSDPNSPQYQAKEWLINDDPLALTPSDTVSDERILQRYALAVFYFATNGPEKWNPNSWMLGNECSGQFWIGLSCNDNDEVRSMAFGKLLSCAATQSLTHSRYLELMPCFIASFL